MHPSLRMNSASLITAVTVLALAGLGHRLLAERVNELLDEYLKPKQPLGSIPLKIGTWAGRDIPMDEQTRRIAGDDDFVNREYSDQAAGRAASVYIGYIGRPRSRLSHRPDVCYPANGYREFSRQKMEVAIEGSKPVPALLFEYEPPSLGGSQQFVLATYAVNGSWVNDTSLAEDYNARGPNLFSHQDAYVARLQISLSSSGDRSADLAVISSFAAQIIAQVQDLLPH